jgi:DNA-binding response OmpR family regulator
MLDFGERRVDLESGRVFGGLEGATLRNKELRALEYLAAREGQAVSRQELLEEVWGYQPGVFSRTTDVTISSLRRKLEPDPKRPRFVQTVHGVGWRLVLPRLRRRARKDQKE